MIEPSSRAFFHNEPKKDVQLESRIRDHRLFPMRKQMRFCAIMWNHLKAGSDFRLGILIVPPSIISRLIQISTLDSQLGMNRL